MCLKLKSRNTWMILNHSSLRKKRWVWSWNPQTDIVITTLHSPKRCALMKNLRDTKTSSLISFWSMGKTLIFQYVESNERSWLKMWEMSLKLERTKEIMMYSSSSMQSICQLEKMQFTKSISQKSFEILIYI